MSRQVDSEEKWYKSLSDDELVELSRFNDQMAIQVLLTRYSNLIRNITYKYFAPGVDRDDLIQEGNIGLLNAIRDYKFEHPTSFKVFCALCVQRQIITAVKSATRQKHSPLNLYISFDKPATDDENSRSMHETIINKQAPSPEELFVERERVVEILTRLKDKLSPFESKVLDGQLMKLSYQEIANMLDKHVKSVDNAMQRIRNKLEKIMIDIRKEDE